MAGESYRVGVAVPVVERGSSVLWLNPGSASRGRAGFSRSVAVVVIESGRPTARIVAL